MEQLEDRMVPSNFTAATVSDLIADINAANLASGSNSITLVAGNTFSLTAVDNITDGATGLPVIAANDNLIILGNGDTIARSTAAGTPAFRLFDVAGGASLTLANLTLQGGLAFGGGVSAEGGAIYSQGNLDLNGVTVQNNTAQGKNELILAGQSTAGGGIYSSGALTLEGSTTVQNNQALGGMGGRGMGGSAFGGGLYVAGGMVTLVNTTLSSNTAHGGQGGTVVHVGPSPSAFYEGLPGGNGSGGALYVAGGTITLTGDTLSSNTAAGGPGGHGSLTWFSNGQGGQGGNGFGAGVYISSGTVALTSNTLSSNSAQGGQGGGSAGYGGRYGSGGNGFGGALYVGGGTITLHNDSSTGNTANGGAGRTAGLGQGGGLYINPLAAVYLDAFTLAHVISNIASTSNNDIFGSYTLIP